MFQEQVRNGNTCSYPQKCVCSLESPATRKNHEMITKKLDRHTTINQRLDQCLYKMMTQLKNLLHFYLISDSRT